MFQMAVQVRMMILRSKLTESGAACASVTLLMVSPVMSSLTRPSSKALKYSPPHRQFGAIPRQGSILHRL